MTILARDFKNMDDEIFQLLQIMSTFEMKYQPDLINPGNDMPHGHVDLIS